MSDGQVVIDITGDASRFRAAIASVSDSAGRQIGALGSGLQSIGSEITKSVTVPTIAAGTAVVGTAVSFLSLRESAQQAFSVMLGSGEAASKMIGDLYAFAKKTPFKFDGMMQSAQQLISMGMAAENVIPTLTAVGDAAAASGRGQESFAAITTALGKMQAQGQVSLEDIWSLSDNGVQALHILANKSGRSIDEMKKAISDGSVDSTWAIQALAEGIEDGTEGIAGSTAKMGGMMSGLKNTFRGACDSMTSSIRNLGLAVVGEYGATDAQSSKFLSTITRVVQQATALVDSLAKKWSEAGLSIEPVAAAVGNALARITGAIQGMSPETLEKIVKAIAGLAAAGPVLVALGKGISLMSTAVGAAAPAVSAFSGCLAAAAKGAGGFASGIAGAAIPAVQAFASSIAHGLVPQSAFDEARRLSTELAYGLRDAKGDIAAALSGAKDAIASKFSGVPDAVASKLGPIKDKVSGLASVLGESAKSAADTFAGKLNLSGASEKAEGALKKVGSAARGMAKGAAVASGVLGAAATGLLGLGIAAAAGGADLQGMADDFDANMQAVTRNLPVIAAQAAQILPHLVQSVTDNLPAFLSAVTDAIGSIASVLPKVLPQLVDGIVKLTGSLASALVSMAPKILDAGLLLFSSLVASFAEAAPQLLDQLPALVEQVASVLLSNAPALLAAGLTLFMALATALLEAAPQIIETLVGTLPQIADALIAFLPQLGAAAGTLFAALANAVPKIAGSLLGAVGSLLQQVPGKVASFASSLADAGYNMLMGLVDGIGKAAGKVLGAAVDAVSGAVDGVLSFLGIKSPSRLFRSIGIYCDEGMAEGISAKAPYVASAMRSMAEKASQAAQGALGGISVPVEFDVPDFPRPSVARSIVGAFSVPAAIDRSGTAARSRRKAGGGDGTSEVVDALGRLERRLDALDRGLGRKIADNTPDEVSIGNARAARRALGLV